MQVDLTRAETAALLSGAEMLHRMSQTYGVGGDGEHWDTVAATCAKLREALAAEDAASDYTNEFEEEAAKWSSLQTS